MAFFIISKNVKISSKFYPMLSLQIRNAPIQIIIKREIFFIISLFVVFSRKRCGFHLEPIYQIKRMNTGESDVSPLTFVASARLIAAVEQVTATNAKISSAQKMISHFFEKPPFIACRLSREKRIPRATIIQEIIPQKNAVSQVTKPVIYFKRIV